MGISLSAFALSLTLAAPAEITYTAEGGLAGMKADGTGVVPVVAPPKGEILDDPAWSPDGSRLVYSQGGEDDGRLMLKDAAGTRELTSKRAGTSDGWPAWSPDGATVAFLRFTSADDTLTTQIVTRDVASGTERALVTQRWDNRGSTVNTPAYSADGGTIAYTYNRYDRSADALPEIRTVPAQGGPSRTLIKRAQAPSYSPDGTRIAYASIADHNGKQCGSDQCFWSGELYVANADGTQPRRLTKDEGDISIPRWSPDGSRILFSSDRNLPDADSEELYTVAPDGSCLTWLTNGTVAAGNPAWRPGSGDSFMADCDPSKRPVAYTPPKTTKFVGNLWLGHRHEGLLLTLVYGGSLYYRDCERFSGCPEKAEVGAGKNCGRFAGGGYELSVRRGWLVAKTFENRLLVFAGRRITFVEPGLLDDLKVRRRETARIPNELLARLSPAQKAKLKPYRSC
ncbi:hypothetical protein OJ997_03050 [Solirubrobacter phytolaccae]|uniref:Uncharacterized protein n=1 Tax=Solirubrobacter phytolaccae TaxID=1404360 RepID=A0A9X3NAS1_9ACTN|nr:hypothetical protein [Solirubrobacter phytolaccae]MDA0179262.1 hypothetical protein [Solirubrobacter phytolaccae]